MDGFSGAVNIIAVIEISAKIFELCQTYVSAVKEARKDIQRLRDGVTSLQDVLTDVKDLEEDPNSSKRSVFSRLNQHNGPVQQCERDLRRLMAQLDIGVGENKMRQFGRRAWNWPFSTKEIDKRLQIINDHKATFALALTSDHFALTRTIKDDIAKLGDGIADMQIEQRTLATSEKQQRIYHWLSSPDPSSNYNTACKSRQATTGEWFLKSDEFKEWKMTSRSCLWLYGIPGCGKSVLSSTVITEVKSQYKSNHTVAIAYFYFDFNDTEKQNHDKFTRSLIKQLAWQSEKTLACLESLFSRNQDGKQQPTKDALELTLQQMLGELEETFIILDALDECKEREELLLLLENFSSWETEKLHVLVTSRRERDIEEALEPLVTSEICLQSDVINVDIHTHICERLQNDSKLRKWPANVRGEIERTLVDGAQGMFRWVVCQLEVLRKCLKVDHLRKALKSLPKTLDETYARILNNIDEEYRQDAFQILQWLVYSARPLSIEEMAEVVAINTEQSKFNPENRLPDSRNLLAICSSLVTTVAVPATDEIEASHEITELRLAHFSVKEYLISDRIRNGSAFQYDVQSRGEEEIGQGCLIYLLHFQRGVLTSENLNTFPLARYAAEYWCHHFRAMKNSDQATNMAAKLFNGDTLVSWIRLFDPDHPWIGSNIDVTEVASPLYYASLQRLDTLVILLLDKGADINAQGGRFGNALQAASFGGYDTTVTLLLEKGADVNAQGGVYGNALQAASSRGHNKIVTLLLEKRADVNTKSGVYGTALQAASFKGHNTIVTLLLEKGADVNAKVGAYGNALQAASFRGPNTFLTLLLEKGAGVNAQSRVYSNALQAASFGGHNTIVTLLLEKGADVNAQGGYCGNALQVASLGGYTTTVTLLLEKGADVNAQDGHFGNALQAASLGGYTTIVTLLLEKGADVNAQGGYCGNALQAASAGGYNRIVTLLLEKGADVNAQGGHFGNALQAASAGGYDTTVTLLLEKGADMNFPSRNYENILEIPFFNDHKTVVALLLGATADNIASK